MKKRFVAASLVLVLIFSLIPGAAFADETAVLSSHAIILDGQPIALNAYNINGYNYFMLRDVAAALSGTGARFDVGWDETHNAIMLTTGTAYNPGGGESVGALNPSADAVPSTANVYVDTRPVNLRAYNINGRNYYMLRDLGDALGFTVDWDASADTVIIGTQPIPQTSGGFNAIAAAEWVSRVRLGWNIGNALDAHGDNRNGFSWLGGGSYANTSVSEMETAWIRPAISRQLVDAVAASGFNAIRIPVTWYKAADADYNIRADWMARVREVVDYAVANDLYIILNSHHDNTIFSLRNENIDESRRAIARIWEQIAEAFKDYSEKLVFQGLNEPRTYGSAAEWSGGTPEEHNNLNILNQVFVDTVRATGGNNAERVLIIPTYAASAERTALNGAVVPNDSASDRIVVSVHSYSPYQFALATGGNAVSSWSADNSSDTNPITSMIDRVHSTFVSQGIPVVFSEMGTINRDNLQARVDWAEFYVGYAHSKGIPCFWWDSGSTDVSNGNETFGIFNRGEARLVFPEIVEAMLRGASRS